MQDRRAVGQPPPGQHLGVGQVVAARDVPGPHAGPRLRGVAAEALGRAGVEHLCGARVQGAPDRVQVGYRGVVQPGVEGPRRARRRLTGLHRVPTGGPRREAAVEDPHVAGAEHGQHPPDPGRGEQTGAVVNHDRHVLGDAQSPHRVRELVRSGKHVRQRRGEVAHLVDVDPDRARDVTGAVLGGRVAVHRRQVPGPVDRHHLRVVQPPGEPGRGHEPGAHVPTVGPGRRPRARRGWLPAGGVR
jgi:hypothetical protein